MKVLVGDPEREDVRLSRVFGGVARAVHHPAPVWLDPGRSRE